MPFTAKDAKKHTKAADSAKKQKQWASVANSALQECQSKGGSDCDARAIKIANAVVAKHNSEAIDWLLARFNSEAAKEVADYFDRLVEDALESTTEAVESVVLENGSVLEIMESESHLAFITEQAVIDIEATEAVNAVLESADSDEVPGKKAVFRAIQGRNEAAKENGISKNKNFYPGDVAESVAPMLEKRPRMYLDHKAVTALGRDSRDLVAMAEKAWAKEGASYVQADFDINNPATSWTWGIVEKYPDQVGVSIHAAVKGRKAKIDNQEVFAVDKIEFLFSLDVVDNPSAGGEFQGFAAEGAEQMATESEDIDLTVLESLKEELDKRKNRSAFWEIAFLLTEMVWSAARDRDMEPEDRKKAIDGLLKEFDEEIRKLDPASLFAPKESEVGDYENETQETVVQQFRRLLHRAIGTDDSNEEIAVETVQTLSPEEDAPVDPEAIKGLSFEQLVAAGNTAVIEMKTQLREAAEKLETKDTEINDLKTEVKERDRRIDEFQLQESERQRTELVSSLLSASTILEVDDPKHVSETFVEDLVLLAGQDGGEEKVKVRISEREALIEAARNAGKVAGNGAQDTVLPESGSNSSADDADTSLFEGAEIVETEDDDDLVASLKAAR